MDEQWNGGSRPPVAPDDAFRQNLNRALQDTHRQQLAKRQLQGGAPGGGFPPAGRTWRRAAGFLAAMALLALVFGLGYIWGRRNR